MKLAAYAMNSGRITDLQAQYGLYTPGDLETFREKLKHDLTQEVEHTSNVDTYVMSSEHCSSRLLDPYEVQRLHDLLAPLFDDIKIVIYLRRQDDFLLSSYSTDVKFGKTEACTVPPEEVAQDRYSYDRLLSRWSDVFGPSALIVKLYDRSKLKQGDILEDFLETVAPGRSQGLERPENANISLDAETLEWLRQFNKHVPFLRNGKINPERGNIALLLEMVSGGPKFSIEAEELEAFMTRFRESNLHVANTFFGGRVYGEGDPLFGPASPRPAGEPLADLSKERMLEIAAEVWRLKHGQVRELQQQVRELKAHS